MEIRLVHRLFFYGLIVPVGALLRLLGRAPVRLAPDRSVKTYWNRRGGRVPEPSSYEREY